jgi:ring-1,2-phenylacetyl-CoA epoxidase subunit PaaE
MSTSSVTPSPAALTKGGFFPLIVAAVDHDTKDSIVVSFTVPEHLAEAYKFVQGQFVTIKVHIGGEELRRSYSICSAVQDNRLRIAIKRAHGGRVSSWLVENLKPGDMIEVMPPDGLFHVPLSGAHKKQYLAFAAGSGITPIFSIIKTTLITEPESSFTLFYGNRATESVMLREELSELKDVFMDRFSLIHVMSREHQDVDMLNGRITRDKAAQLIHDWCPVQSIDTIFLCGPQQMVSEVREALQQAGVPDARIMVELFTADGAAAARAVAAPAADAGPTCSVTVIADGRRHAFRMHPANESILDAALNEGIDLRHSCKSGVCATCRAKLVEGNVTMDVNYALREDELARGFILTCQSHPLTDTVVVDFDQDN